ncbi:restriction endonuclease subunit S, partial [Aeromonas sp. QDB56]|uniref:restriction endonuclease subunit S n=1 Tax=Aeromonas sp. QDB56 TaxID=2990495 RepID=UPI0022DF1D1F
GSLSRYSKSTVRRHRRVSHFEVEFAAYLELREHAAGGAQPNLNVGKIASTVIPLPPIDEQHRIVAKVDELMTLCDQLKSRLQTSQQTQLALAESLVEGALS